MSIFEALMMIFFGVAWPFSIYKSYKSKSNNGKSLWFLLIALSGYIFGIIHKILYNYDNVIFLYIFNFIMIFVDSCLYLRNYIVSNKKSD
ncbi:hypothetical protein ATZ36_11485 [Candidatus Endomicrobiellum trichonymphae]|uniref:PQ loop repeat protein n=1 Tax=Endomicrobium trichonymphae TaxID=1408204 RepID=A0A1E5IF94_ENDTX|nr:hypothetical protein ATZ36_11485 [Candidatus Endomicrobium trichonymphae]